MPGQRVVEGQDVRDGQGDRDNLRAERVRLRNRRKTYLDANPGYFAPALELADPLLYDRCIRRFQTPEEREAEGRKKGWSGILEADLERAEAKISALANPPSATVTYTRGPHGEIYPEDPADVPQTKEEGYERWRNEMTQRFLRGEDDDFDYGIVDQSEDWDDKVQEERDAEDKWFAEEEPSWMAEDGVTSSSIAPERETGIQDF